MERLSEKERARISALEAAEDSLNGKLGIIEGCRHLSRLAVSLLPSRTGDEDFVVFTVVDSETGARPVGNSRQVGVLLERV